jgi:hypothetical protein
LTRKRAGEAPRRVDALRDFAGGLPRSTEGVVQGRLKFRVGRIVYVAFSRDETLMGFAFSREERNALVDTDPEKFMLPSGGDLRYNWVVARLEAMDLAEACDWVLDAWLFVVPETAAREYLARKL